MSKNTYEGWKNAATWAVSFQLRNQKELNEYFIALAVAAIDTTPETVKGKRARRIAARRALSVILQDKITEMNRTVRSRMQFVNGDERSIKDQYEAGTQILEAMITAGFNSVDWQEIAEDFLITADEYKASEAEKPEPEQQFRRRII